MKKDRPIGLFTLIYILIFPLLYALSFHDLRGYIFFMLILMILSAPSLFTVLILLAFQRFKEKHIPEYIYFSLSILITSVCLTLLKYSDGDPKNIYPIFEEHLFFLIALCVCSHLIAFTITKLIKKN